MLKQSISLWSLSMKNMFGINEFRYGKDPDKKKRSTVMAIVWTVVAIVFEIYFLLSMAGYVLIGMQEILPIYCYTLTSAMVLMFTMLKAGSVIFQMNTYEQQIVLPVPHSAIVISRFMTMYSSNVLFAAAIMVPGMLVYGLVAEKGILFYLLYLLGVLFAPLVPMVAATAVAAVIKGISARMKHRSLVEAFLMIGLVAGMLLLTTNVGEGFFSIEEISTISNSIAEQISHVYPLAGWFDIAVKEIAVLPVLTLIVVSVAIFTLFIFVVQFFFAGICTALNVTVTKNNYTKVKGERNSLLVALIKREFRYYFSQSVYMMNTMMGLILMVVAAITLTVVGSESLEAQLPIKGVATKMLPFVFALAGSLVSPTAASISLEGKTRWLTKSLPISEKMQYDSKLLMAYLLDAPFYVLSVGIAAIGMKVTGFDLVWLIVLPAVYLFFGAIWGQSANLWFPNFTWESEVYVVKQGAAVLVSMLGGVFSVIIPMILFMGIQMIPTVGEVSYAGLAGNIFLAVISVIITMAGVLLYRNNCNKVI